MTCATRRSGLSSHEMAVEESASLRPE
jgi:hypothetical protein